MTDNLYRKLSEERKQLQEQGLVPEWYTTAGWQLFKEKYLFATDRAVKGQFERIAKTAAKHLKGTSLESFSEDKFFGLLWKGWLSPSTPVLANMGTDRGLPVSCSGTYIDDSIDGFYSNRREVAILTKNGFGTASYLGDIRPRGASISRGGKASGPLPVFKGMVQDMRDVAQGTARRGAWAGYIEIDHESFDEITDYISAEPDDANIGWIVKDKFVAALNSGDEEAIRRFQKAMKMKMVTGKGYFMFIDKVNRKRPESYVKNNLEVLTSQLCVAPETKILTRAGYIQIDELENQLTDVWNGSEFSEVMVRKTGTNQRLIKVVTDSGQEIECTPYHKFLVHVRGKGGSRKESLVEAKDLKIGDKLAKCSFPIIDGSQVLEYAYENGLFSAEGCYTDQGKRTYLYHGKRDLRQYLSDIYDKWTVQDNLKREYAHSSKLQEKYFVPLDDYSVASKISWFAGYCDGDGCRVVVDKTQGIQICCTNKEFLQDVQLMLQTIGVSSKVKHQADAGYRMMPANDSTGELKEYWCAESWRILLGQNAVTTLLELGFKTHRLQFTDHKANRECCQFSKVAEVIDDGRYSDTFCFNEPLRHMGVFNGIYTGNCSEITLFCDKDHTFTCVLSSMNVSKYDEFKDTDAVFWATVFLDCVAQEFIEKASSISGLEKAVRYTEKGRSIGLGQCGFHTYLQQKMIPFENFEAHMLNLEIAAHIDKESLKASKFLATELGEPEWCKGLGLRFTHRIAVAPTKSTALLMGGVSEGINPDPAMSFTQLTAAGEVDRLNPILLELMKSKGIYSTHKVKEITDKQGSVQHVTWLTADEKAVFKTAFEIHMKAVLRLASTRARYIDQWQSLNLFFSADEKPEVIAEVHQEAFEDESILGLYYIYTQAGVQSADGECIACQ